MKKSVPLFLLLLFFVSTAEQNSFVEFPIFSGFYKIDQHKNSGHKNEQKHPLVTHSIHYNYNLDSPFYFEAKENSMALLKTKTISTREIFYSNSIINSIWQPPKISV